jgi:hypothetical protein
MSLLERLDRLDLRSGVVRPVDPNVPRPTVGAIVRELVRPPTLWITIATIVIVAVASSVHLGFLTYLVPGLLIGSVGQVAARTAMRRQRAASDRPSS